MGLTTALSTLQLRPLLRAPRSGRGGLFDADQGCETLEGAADTVAATLSLRRGNSVFFFSGDGDLPDEAEDAIHLLDVAGDAAT